MKISKETIIGFAIGSAILLATSAFAQSSTPSASPTATPTPNCKLLVSKCKRSMKNVDNAQHRMDSLVNRLQKDQDARDATEAKWNDRIAANEAEIADLSIQMVALLAQCPIGGIPIIGGILGGGGDAQRNCNAGKRMKRKVASDIIKRVSLGRSKSNALKARDKKLDRDRLNNAAQQVKLDAANADQNLTCGNASQAGCVMP